MRKVLYLLLCVSILAIGSTAFAQHYLPIPVENANVNFYNSEDGQDMYMINEGNEPVVVAYCLITIMGKCNPFDTNPTACGMGNPRAEDITPEQFYEAISHWRAVILWPDSKHIMWYRICPGRAQHQISAIYFKPMEGEAKEGFLEHVRKYKSSWSFQ